MIQQQQKQHDGVPRMLQHAAQRITQQEKGVAKADILARGCTSGTKACKGCCQHLDLVIPGITVLQLTAGNLLLRMQYLCSMTQLVDMQIRCTYLANNTS
jgi:hypothetical protein